MEISKEIVEGFAQWKVDNPNSSVPHSMCVGYWNSLQFFLGRLGFKIVKRQPERYNNRVPDREVR